MSLKSSGSANEDAGGFKGATPTARSDFEFRDGAIDATIDCRAYRLVAVQKTAYKLADRFTAVLGALEGHLLPVKFTFRAGTTPEAASEGARLFFQELLDQELREQIGEETRPLRSLILAHAFSRTDLIRRD